MLLCGDLMKLSNLLHERLSEKALGVVVEE